MSTDNRLRLLFCHKCMSVDEIPWYEGPPDNDDLLMYRVSQHQFPSGRAHPLDLGVVQAEDWQNQDRRQEILRKLHMSGAPGTALGMGADFYDVKANFADDAMACWKAHNRTTDCGDYMSPAKRLDPGTKADRREAGITTRRPSTSLCQFCPVQSVKMQLRRAARGDYDKQSWEPS